MFKLLTKDKKKRSEQDELFHRALVCPGPDLLVCDEGHLLKNDLSEIYKALNHILGSQKGKSEKGESKKAMPF
ncbi:hypothetical protein DAPPUDRAFT_316616 [Daphnia pulex]|uniref:SNF2 N-terminal domain-containing protein n=1 Tax=Daphnia pulex TaxID=6669 RepID=E9GDG8_DAPPU|nr:hypothetical protein DAPPUDRAFT_316616 [Daphnia pulex]|eukprot:EFX82480.1 hypothetical protein DAPPUDRAFT_316616 [Daphnia pulex]